MKIEIGENLKNLTENILLSIISMIGVFTVFGIIIIRLFPDDVISRRLIEWIT